MIEKPTDEQRKIDDAFAAELYKLFLRMGAEAALVAMDTGLHHLIKGFDQTILKGKALGLSPERAKHLVYEIIESALDGTTGVKAHGVADDEWIDAPDGVVPTDPTVN